MCRDAGCRGNKIIRLIGHLTLDQYGLGIVYRLDQSSGFLSDRGVGAAFVHNTIMVGQDLLVSSGKRDSSHKALSINTLNLCLNLNNMKK